MNQTIWTLCLNIVPLVCETFKKQQFSKCVLPSPVLYENIFTKTNLLKSKPLNFWLQPQREGQKSLKLIISAVKRHLPKARSFISKCWLVFLNACLKLLLPTARNPVPPPATLRNTYP